MIRYEDIIKLEKENVRLKEALKETKEHLENDFNSRLSSMEEVMTKRM